MTKILNLDELETTIEKVIVLKGVKHPFVPFSVGDFIDNLKEMEANAKREDVPMSEYMEHMIGMVQRSFPSIPEQEVRDLPMEKLKAITDFIKGVTEEEALAGIQDEQDAEAKK